ncbi:MAG: hypothetical protein N2378_13835 [Chloroflexaceae bacterium]|nr:hypothetical protein [Chloroflexaceae bacterium]
MSKPSFDEALRQLDQALQRLERAAPEAPPGAEGSPEAPVQPAGAPAPPAPRPRGRRRGAIYRASRHAATASAATLPPTGAPTIRLDETAPPVASGPVAPGERGAPIAGEPVAPEERAAPIAGGPVASGERGAPAEAVAVPPPPPTEALLRLAVGAALLGLDGLAARSGAWEAAAGISRSAETTPDRNAETGAGRFRHALIGWLFEAEAHLRPRGNPIAWLRTVVAYLFGTVFSVVIEMLPLPRFGARRGRRANADPTDEDTRRWIDRGLAEEGPSRRFARAALEDMLHRAIIYAADRPAVAQALGAIVRSPAMDDAVEHIVAGPVVERAIERVAASPALDTVVARVAASPALDTVIDSVAESPALNGAIGKIVRTPAMEDAVTYLTETPAMDQAIETLSQNPALAELVRSQSGSLARDILNDVRSRAIQGDQGLESLARRLLRRPPRASLPPEARGLLVAETTGDPDGQTRSE